MAASPVSTALATLGLARIVDRYPQRLADTVPALAPEELGSAGSRLEIVDVAFPESGGGAQIIEGDPATAAKILVEKLRQEGIV